jgi:hypothetical protein
LGGGPPWKLADLWNPFGIPRGPWKSLRDSHSSHRAYLEDRDSSKDAGRDGERSAVALKAEEPTMT